MNRTLTSAVTAHYDLRPAQLSICRPPVASRLGRPAGRYRRADDKGAGAT
jgi:hypothetical protein